MSWSRCRGRLTNNLMGRTFEYAVSLHVKHPELGSAEITSNLHLKPRRNWTVGEPRRTPKGTPLEGVYKESYCCFEFGEGEDGELANCLRKAIGELRRYKPFLQQIRASGGSLEFFVFWYPNGDTGGSFDPELLGEMAELGITLGINVYDGRDALLKTQP